MNSDECFVIMAIGQVDDGSEIISEDELRQKYNTLIKEAIETAIPDLEVVRADEVAIPGTITTDIVTRIMHSKLVVADITYPNPNVYYELGLRHACRPGTIIIRDSATTRPPFDIAHLRHIEYENTIPGLHKLRDNIKRTYENMEKYNKPDNHFLEMAKLTKYEYPDFSEKDKAEEADNTAEIFMSMMGNPDVMNLMIKASQGEELDQAGLMKAVMQDPKTAAKLMQHLARTGKLKI